MGSTCSTMRWLRRLPATLVTCVLSGCVAGSRSHIADHDVLRGFAAPATVRIVTAPPAPFRVVTAQRDSGPLCACVGSYPVTGSEQPVRGCPQLPDSAQQLAELLRQQWLEPLGVTVTATVSAAHAAPTCGRDAGLSDFLLHLDWHLHHFAYQPLGWRSYDYVGGARIRLLDCRRGYQEVFRAFCAVGWPTGDPRQPLAAMHVDLMADPGARVSAILIAAAQRCASKLSAAWPRPH